jgi:hypothetical protein
MVVGLEKRAAEVGRAYMLQSGGVPGKTTSDQVEAVNVCMGQGGGEAVTLQAVVAIRQALNNGLRVGKRIGAGEKSIGDLGSCVCLAVCRSGWNRSATVQGRQSLHGPQRQPPPSASLRRRSRT